MKLTILVGTVTHTAESVAQRPSRWTARIGSHAIDVRLMDGLDITMRSTKTPSS
jgi:hypothetical protein